MKLYHITPEVNLDEILLRGLIPGYKRGLTSTYLYHRQEVSDRIWLTDDPQFILDTQAGEEWQKLNYPIILTINCIDLNVEPKIVYAHYVGGEICPHEFMFYGIITPDRIVSKSTGELSSLRGCT